MSAGFKLARGNTEADSICTGGLCPLVDRSRTRVAELSVAGVGQLVFLPERLNRKR